jgi:putative oxidoreductase
MILTSLTKVRDWGLLFLRVALGAFYLYVHGWPKLAGGVHTWREIGMATHYVGIHFLPVFWGLMAALSETLGCVLVILGFLFRPACIGIFITLLVASAMHLGRHQGLDTAAQAIELAILFFSLLFIGPGKYSVDKN